ncbi:hypothetical protein U472_12030 [Orenia metallireducens]|uniref:Deacetylase PdaC domain-containing protein n=1 Tax=Orenia metallireducens TaxID=1413210 RepID=A0A1C0A8X0_9FIRM|nr:DUF3298 and DUF4163 domain-containing protein [Orenia metallireducens]OCL26696.1 hypothetical protein U472_12030 [Orenia metallireducens]
MKKKILIGLLISMLYSSSLYATTPITLSSYKESTPLEQIKIKEERIKMDNKLIKIDLKIPKISGMKNKKLQNRLNRTFKNKIVNFSNNLKNIAKKHNKDAQDYEFPIYPYQSSTDYQVYYNKDNILSLTITYYEYTGGAHGNYFKEAFNINLHTGKELSLGDLLGKNKDYQKTINDKIKNKIRKHQELYFADDTHNLKILSKNSNFYLQENNLVIYFQVYEIAPYSTGTPEFKIPLKLFKF